MHLENRYRESDGITEQMEDFIINVCDDDSSDLNESMGVEYLELDFDCGSE